MDHWVGWQAIYFYELVPLVEVSLNPTTHRGWDDNERARARKFGRKIQARACARRAHTARTRVCAPRARVFFCVVVFVHVDVSAQLEASDLARYPSRLRATRPHTRRNCNLHLAFRFRNGPSRVWRQVRRLFKTIAWSVVRGGGIDALGSDRGAFLPRMNF